MALQAQLLPTTYRLYLASKHALHLRRILTDVNCTFTQLLTLASHDARGFTNVPTTIIVAANEGMRKLTDLCGQRECRDFRLQHVLAHFAGFWEHSLLPTYAWVLQSLWTDDNADAGVQSDARTLVSDLRSNIEEFLISFLPSKPCYHHLEDFDLDSWSGLLLAIVRTQIPFCLARELERLRHYLLETAKFPQPAVRVVEATRCLLLSARVAHLGLRQIDACGSIANSRMLEHACALRLALAERPWNWDATDTDSCLFGLLKRASQGLPWRWIQGVPSCAATTVLLSTPHFFSGDRLPADLPPEARRVCGQLWQILSHAAVQCYLGWWLAASTTVLRTGGFSSSLSLPADSMMVSCRACWQRRNEHEDGELQGLQAPLYAAAASWVYGMLTRQCRGSAAAARGVATPSLPDPSAAVLPVVLGSRPTSAAAASTTTDDATAVAALHDGTSSLSSPQATLPPPPSSGTAATAAVREHVSADGANGAGLPYGAQNMYDIIYPVGEHLLDFNAAVRTLGSLFADTLAVASMSLSHSLQHMTADAAVARLPGCWQLLGRILAMDFGSMRSRTLRDLAQAASGVLRLQLPGYVVRPEPAVTAGVAARVRRATCSSGGSRHDAINGSATINSGDGVGDGEGGLPSPLQELHQQPQLPPQPPWLDPQQRPQHGRQRPQLARWVHSPHLPPSPPPRHDHRYQSPSFMLRCTLGSLFWPSLEGTLRVLLHASGPGCSGGASCCCCGGLNKADKGGRLNAAYDLTSACIAVDLVLRRPGCWPALLAHGPPQQVASLILTMRKVMIAANAMELPQPSPPPASAAATQAQPVGDPRVIWRLQLIALLEQCLPFTLTPGAAAAAVSGAAAAATAAAAAADGGGGNSGRSSPGQNSPLHFSASQLSSLGAVMMAPVLEPPGPHLYVNHGLCGVRGPWACHGGVAANDDDDDDIHAGPGWLEVLGFGACPAIGSLVRALQERMMVLAAYSWLPLLLTTLEDNDDMGAAGGGGGCAGNCRKARLVAVPIAVLGVHGGHRVVWQWLLLLTRQCLAAVGTAAHEGWMRLLRRVLIVDQITAILRLYCTWALRRQQIMTTEAALIISSSGGAAGVAVATNGGISASATVAGAPRAQCTQASSECNDGGSGGCDGAKHAEIDQAFYKLHEEAMRATEVLPTVLDVLETLAAAAPEAIALALADNRKARELISVAEDLSTDAIVNGDTDLPYPGAGSPAAVAVQRRLRQQRQRREELRQAALPPAWGPGLPLDAHVVSVLSMYDRHGLMYCLGELSTARGDRFSFRPQGLAAPTAPMPFGVEDVGWRTLPDPVVVRQQLGFSLCAYEGCANLEGSSEAKLLMRAGGGGRTHPTLRYCCVSCQQADRQASPTRPKTWGSELRQPPRGVGPGVA